MTEEIEKEWGTAANMLSSCEISLRGQGIQDFIKALQVVEQVYMKAYDGFEKELSINALNTWDSGVHFYVLCNVKVKSKKELTTYFEREKSLANMFDLKRAAMGSASKRDNTKNKGKP